MSQEILKHICLFCVSLCMQMVCRNTFVVTWVYPLWVFFYINDMSQKVCVYMILFYINDMSQNICVHIILFYRSLFMEKVLTKMVCRNKYVRMIYCFFFIWKGVSQRNMNIHHSLLYVSFHEDGISQQIHVYTRILHSFFCITSMSQKICVYIGHFYIFF